MSCTCPSSANRSAPYWSALAWPTTEHPSVGNPPITRWDYREFSVYFEHTHVINSVRHHQPGAALPDKEQQ